MNNFKYDGELINCTVLNQMLNAICFNDLFTVRFTLENNELDINQRFDESGNTFLHLARDAEIARELLKYDANVNVLNYDHYTPIATAVEQQKDHKLIEEFINHGARLTHLYGSRGDTLLHMTNDTEVARKLLSRGFDVNAVNLKKRTALSIAVLRNKRLSLVRLLLEHGSHVNIQFSLMRNTVLHFVDNLAILNELLKYGGNLDLLNDHGESPLYYAIKQNRDIKIIEKFLEYETSASINRQFGFAQSTMLHVAKRYDIAEILIARGADCNIRNESLRTALHTAILDRKDIRIVELLLKSGVDVNAKDRLEATALILAGSRDLSAGYIELLLKYGADPNVSDAWSSTLLYNALKNAEFNSVQLKHRNDYMSEEEFGVFTKMVDHGARCNYKCALLFIFLDSEVIGCRILGRRFLKYYIYINNDDKTLDMFSTSFKNSTMQFFYAKCVNEILRMQLQWLSRSCTLYQYIRPMNPNARFHPRLITNNMLKNYLLYRDFIINKYKKDYVKWKLLQAFVENPIRTPRSNHMNEYIVLNPELMYCLSKYLTDNELKICIKAFS